jgi:large subunit ribosomal protein L11
MKKIKEFLKLKIKGGSANPSPPIGPALGSKGLNIMKFCKEFNEKTKNKKGDILSVLITIYEDKTFSFVIKSSPTSFLVMKFAKIEKGSSEPNRKKVGSITWDQVKEISKIKLLDLNSFSLKSSMKMIAGTCRSMGINIIGDSPF